MTNFVSLHGSKVGPLNELPTVEEAKALFNEYGFSDVWSLNHRIVTEGDTQTLELYAKSGGLG